MRTVSWYQQNEATDADGFFLQPPDVYEAERQELAGGNCPDTDKIEFQSHEIEDRDSAFISALVTEATYEWMVAQDIVEFTQED